MAQVAGVLVGVALHIGALLIAPWLMGVIMTAERPRNSDIASRGVG